MPLDPKGHAAGVTPPHYNSHPPPTWRVGHNSDRSIAHNHCSSAFFFLSNYHSLKYNQWYCVWLLGAWKCRHGTWQSLHFNHCNREQICSTLLCKFTADLPTSLDPRPFWPTGQSFNVPINAMPYYSPLGEDDGNYMGGGLKRVAI